MSKLYLVGLLSACCILNAVRVYADDCDGATETINGLCQEFQLLEDLAPLASVKTLIQKHNSNDIRYRKAVQYMFSSEFNQTTAKIDSSVTYQGFMKQFTNAGVNISDINSIAKIFNCLAIPDIADGDARTSFYNENIPESRSLDTFIDEFIQLIPRTEFVDTLKAQIAENKQFAKFYKIVRNPTFRAQVMQSFNNRDISRPLKQLRRNQIDLCKLTKTVFNLLYLGPAV